ncbi:MAG: HAMP domain-containing sensor histidine kinase [Polaromonas sp.]
MTKPRPISPFSSHTPGRWTFAPLEPILHPAPRRLRIFALAVLLGQPLFGWIWSSWLVQPYENLWLRGLMSALGAALLLPAMGRDFSNPATRLLITLVMWLEIPFFFSWMYFCNAGNPAWLAAVCTVIVCYYHLTDWRIATAGIFSGALLAWTLFLWLLPMGPSVAGPWNAANVVVIMFSWTCALLLGVSAANLRQEQLAHTLLATMRIMAHELRTPLSTAALIGDAVQMEAERQPEHPRAAQLDKLGQRLHMLVRNMNQQIDTQIANAKLLQLPRHTDRVSASALVQDVVANYPYAANRQRDCVTVTIHDDFVFLSSDKQFSQVLGNLIKNALHSLMAADSRYPAGALRIEVGRNKALGRIVVTDEGMGISPALLPRIFKPFLSNDRGTGHGLGLAFCQQVVRSAGGTIQVKSEFAAGATFAITLPVAA